ncbi:MBL fold metallo-hydrolase [Spongiactinospora sp. TRM90649]|uniref:pyrroloquinoline quinone biosynthesis protein PqqB n=1 Tax=Spongiactinospora sp. TRM90649 TaxID=3031114 RepID=UPI0023F95DA5|nr:MBL fold metallo-hydrolase [Spongiactinospora sp. TRM90649]MDF5758089.1 MBL fold metallo-hydrolase [Spongiactinospora sp. TRM90649]
MRLRVLGTAAGGGVPQWNCACPGCRGARAHPERRRLHASLAVEAAPGRAYIVNATPDLGEQVESCPWLLPGPGPRDTPLAGVLLTDAELDHTLGVPRLREADELEIWSTPAVREAVAERLGLDALLAPYVGLTWRGLPSGDDFEPLGGPGGPECTVEVSSIPLSDKRPRYAAGPGSPEGDWVVALWLRDRATGGSLLYAPAMGVWPPALDEAAYASDCVIVDGTFWDDEEPLRSGFSKRTATQMGHLPVTETAARLTALPGRALYTHLNNTSPLVDPDSPERAELAALGLAVAEEGMVIEL